MKITEQSRANTKEKLLSKDVFQHQQRTLPPPIYLIFSKELWHHKLKARNREHL